MHSYLLEATASPGYEYCSHLIVENTHVGGGAAYFYLERASADRLALQLIAKPIGTITDQKGTSIGVSLFVKFVKDP